MTSMHCADVAAALAAVGTLFQLRDATFAAHAILKAKQLYNFATANDAHPRSYCDFVPCATNVTVTKEFTTRVVDSIEVNTNTVDADGVLLHGGPHASIKETW
jgi:hypothetical protein